MNRFISNPNTGKALHQAAGFLLFILFASGAFLITLGVHANILQIAAILNASRNFYRVMYTAGTFLLFIPYVFLVVFLEAYMRGGVQKNLLRHRAVKVAVVEAGLGALILLVNWLTTVWLLKSP